MQEYRAAGSLHAGEETGVPARESGGPLASRSLVSLMLALGLAQLCIAGLIGWTIYAERHVRAVARNEANALLAVNQLVGAALDAETGQRGYLLTGREPYLEPYMSSKKRLASCESVLTTILNGDQAMQPHLAALERGVDSKLAELDDTLALVRAGKRDEALKLVNTGLGKQHMETVRGEAHWLTVTLAGRRRAAVDRVGAIESRSLVLVTLFALGSVALVVIGLRSERSRAGAAAEAEQAAALREANERSQLLARELNHRVKNFFAIVSAIVSLSARKRPEAAAVAEDIRSRIHALSLAHDVSLGQLSGNGVTIETLVQRISAPYGVTGEERLRLSGPRQPLSPEMVTPLGLIVHELATNAVKYGALSNDAGWVEVRWDVLPMGDNASELHLSWIELAGPALSNEPQPDAPMGFGTRMIELAVRQLGGRIEREWPESGVVVRVACPVH